MSTNETIVFTNSALSYSLKFTILLVLQIPSILVSIIIFIYFATDRAAREKKYNLSILVLLTINFLQVVFDLPMPMHFFRLNGIVQPATSAYCIWWTWYEFSLNTSNGIVMAWISIERHILIFHSGFIRNLTVRKRQLFYVVPLVICPLWGPLYYMVVIIFSPMCINTQYFDSLLCGLPCYLLTNWGTFDLCVNVVSPVLIIFISNLTLCIFIIHQKSTANGRVRNSWRRETKMTFQLALISFVYLAVWIPVSTTQLGQIFVDPSFLSETSDTFNYLTYIVPLVLPMVCLMSMPMLIQKYRNLIFTRCHLAVVPFNGEVTYTNRGVRSLNTVT